MDNGVHAQHVHEIASKTADNLLGVLQPHNADSRNVLALAVRSAVLRAFGCTCTPGRVHRLLAGDDEGPVHFEDITCPVHGMGPMHQPPDARTEPGS